MGAWIGVFLIQTDKSAAELPSVKDRRMARPVGQKNLAYYFKSEFLFTLQPKVNISTQ